MTYQMMGFKIVKDSKEPSRTLHNALYLITKLQLLCARPGRLGAVCPADKTPLSLGTSVHQAHSSRCLVGPETSQPPPTAWLEPGTQPQANQTPWPGNPKLGLQDFSISVCDRPSLSGGHSSPCDPVNEGSQAAEKEELSNCAMRHRGRNDARVLASFLMHEGAHQVPALSSR